VILFGDLLCYYFINYPQYLREILQIKKVINFTDTILLAESESDLQNFWNIFEDGNKVNVEKKKILIFET
jgi:hypothetical protein